MTAESSKDKKIKRFAVDLTWVRHGIVGGTESFACNLLEGFAEYVRENPGAVQIVLLTAGDNIEVFRKYHLPDEGMRCVTCNTVSADRKMRLLWQNLKMRRTLKRLGIDTVLEPIYAKPFLGTHGIRYFTVIHDLQAWHYPEYFSKARVLWMKWCWRYSVRTSEQVVAISDFVRQDILEKMRCPAERVVTIHNPVVTDGITAGDAVLTKYSVKRQQYYYTVSSMVPHKNLITLIRALGILKRKGSGGYLPLVLSGVGGEPPKELERAIKEEGLQDAIRFTGFIDAEERNRLYYDCRAFLFPSIFEGFGMPPVEAMAFGVPVLTTDKTSLKEVTGSLAHYVEDALDPVAWAVRMEQELAVADKTGVTKLLDEYDRKMVAEQYLKVIFPG